jgi:hypothetical protein
VNYKIIARGWMDLCNPGAGYESSSASQATKVDLVAGHNYDYTIYLQPNVYQVEAGHRLALVIYAYEPGKASYTQNYTITIKNNSVAATIPLDDSELGELTTAGSGGTTAIPAETPSTTEQPDGSFAFTDVSTGSYAHDAIIWAVEQGITNGTGATAFSPKAGCTRAQVVTFLWRAAGSPKASGSTAFTDVPSGSYYADAVAWAVEQGITNGTSATTFHPNATCSRAQIVTFLARYSDGEAANNGTSFTDVPSGAYYAQAVAWAVEQGITNGTSATTFSPKVTCTREQVVTFLYRLLG